MDRVSIGYGCEQVVDRFGVGDSRFPCMVATVAGGYAVKKSGNRSQTVKQHALKGGKR